jgi:hypothetical protein
MCLIVYLKWCFCVSTVILHLNLCDKLVRVCSLYCYSIRTVSVIGGLVPVPLGFDHHTSWNLNIHRS